MRPIGLTKFVINPILNSLFFLKISIITGDYRTVSPMAQFLQNFFKVIDPKQVFKFSS
jgi:hypothetical protein